MTSPGRRVVRTVLGDVEPARLGRTDYHEHLLQVSPLLDGDGLDDVDRSTEEAVLLRKAGIEALVELTPIGLGRDPSGVRAIAERSGLNVVLATGVHREEHYPAQHPLHEVGSEQLARRFTAELTDVADADPSGAGPAQPVVGVRAGVIKVGIGYWSISPFERRNLEAAAAAHRATDAAIVCHLELGTAAFELLEVLSSLDVAHERIVLAHVDRNPDPGLHLELARAGAYLGYDGPGRTKYWPDSALLDCLIAVAEGGGSQRLLLGGDVARRSSFESYGGMPGMAYLARRFVPRIEQRGGRSLVDTILVDNPARVFALPADD